MFGIGRRLAYPGRWLRVGATPSAESRTWFPSSPKLRLRAVLGPAFTPGLARCRARHRRMPVKGSSASLPHGGCLLKGATRDSNDSTLALP